LPNAEKFKYTPINTEGVGGGVLVTQQPQKLAASATLSTL
jgi:hypothetical protein